MRDESVWKSSFVRGWKESNESKSVDDVPVVTNLVSHSSAMAVSD
jgi:hypothetical protein